METKQKWIHSGFGPGSTTTEVIRGSDLCCKNIIITGCYSGIGLETTRALSSVGATVIVPARTPEKAHAALLRHSKG
jgi:NADP-dependent 3-hydroxy acid dehydrogenase YdfG